VFTSGYTTSADNKNEGAKDSVVLTYCKCMVDKMPEAETASVTHGRRRT
jgi:hypothetical protein